MPAGRILVADDDVGICTVLKEALKREGFEVTLTGTASGLWRLVESGAGDLVITDVVMPDESAFELLPRIKKLRPSLPIVVMSARNTFMTAIKASERGAYDYLPKPFDLQDLVTMVRRALKKSAEDGSKADGSKTNGESATHHHTALNTAPRNGHDHDHAFDPEFDGKSLVGRSSAMQDIYRSLARLMQTDLTVTIIGESGTGKELVARALHDFGKRRKGAFVAINMAAIPRDLIESELFGHEKGAFTGANTRAAGRFEQAEGGTLFLDEIGDMPMEAQTRLLRVLQQGEYTTIGGRVPIKANVRIVAATNKDLWGLIRQGLFREDLFYRLNVAPLRLPPLRERLEDIPDLVQCFLSRAKGEGLPQKRFDASALTRLQAHSWPGNIRELENFVRRMLVLCPEDVLDESAVASALVQADWFLGERQSESALDRAGQGKLASPVAAQAAEPVPAIVFASPAFDAAISHEVERQFAELAATTTPDVDAVGDVYRLMLRAMEKPLLRAALQATQNNRLRAADLLGINRNTLLKKLRDLGLDGL